MTAPLEYTYKRYTFRGELEAEGVGLHTGSKSRILIKPSSDGLQFKVRGKRFRVSPKLVSETKLGVSLSYDGVKVLSVEHLLSAFAILGITDCLVEFSEGYEVPSLDGSSSAWVELLRKLGRRYLGTKVLRYLSSEAQVGPVPIGLSWVRGDLWRSYRLVAFRESWLPGSLIVYDIYWKGIYQRATLFLPADRGVSYKDNYLFSQATTFGHLSDLPEIFRSSLAKGAKLDNALLVTNYGFSRPLKFKNELALHKITDLIGDLYLLGFLPYGVIYALNAGHELHVRLATELSGVIEVIGE